MPSFPADVPTLFAVVILTSLSMAAGIAVVGWSRHNDGLRWWSLGLLLHAAAYALFSLRGRIPDGLSVLTANLMLGAVFVCMQMAVRQFHGLRMPWRAIAALMGILLLSLLIFRQHFVARVIVVSLVLGAFATATLWDLVSEKRRRVGRGAWLLAAALAFQCVVFVIRVVMVLQMDGEPRLDRMLTAGGGQTLTFFTAFLVVLLGSVGFVFMSRDRADESNRVLAAQDPLTGVANRRSLIAALDRDMARALRMREPMALMMVDVDHFKGVNDRYGHPVGDRVLCGVADVLRQRLRAQDLVGRYGGEEFMVLLPDTGLRGAEQLARELCKAVEDLHCPIDGMPGPGIAVTVSIGVFGGPLESADSWDMLIAAADRALYQAKKNGRNRVEVVTGLRRPSAQMANQISPETQPGSLL